MAFCRWVDGELLFYDPATEESIATFESERTRADTQQTRADAAEARAEQERADRIAAESRAAELEAELRRLRGE